MDSVQTLHDFALNLLNDPTALAAFGADPQQALALAGLGDVSAADVHEVIPLVLDYVPVDSLPAVGDLGLTGVDSVSHTGTDAGGVQGAIDQLTALTQGLGLPAVPGLPGVGSLPGLPAVGDLPGLPAVGALPGVGSLPGVNDLTNVTNTAAGVTALAGNATGSLGLGSDLSRGLDSAALGNLTAAPAYLTDNNSGAFAGVANEAHQVAGLGLNEANGLAGFGADQGQQLVGQGLNEANGLAGFGADQGHQFVGDLTGHLPGADAVSGVTGQVGDFSGILGGATGLDVPHVAGGLTHGAGLGDVTNVVKTGIGADHDNVGDVAGHVSDVATTAVGSEVHDVVSDVSHAGHNALGNLHVGDVASGNELHIGL